MARTNRKPIAITSSGLLLSADIGSIDFEGAGQSGSVILDAITMEITSGSGGGSTPVAGEVLTFSGSTATISNTPVVGSVMVMMGGNQATLNTDYTISGAVVTALTSMLQEISQGAVIMVNYS